MSRVTFSVHGLRVLTKVIVLRTSMINMQNTGSFAHHRHATMQAQLGMMGAVSERAPQKYLIQNQSGVRLFYWAERVRWGSGRARARVRVANKVSGS